MTSEYPSQRFENGGTTEPVENIVSPLSEPTPSAPSSRKVQLVLGGSTFVVGAALIAMIIVNSNNLTHLHQYESVAANQAIQLSKQSDQIAKLQTAAESQVNQIADASSKLAIITASLKVASDKLSDATTLNTTQTSQLTSCSDAIDTATRMDGEWRQAGILSNAAMSSYLQQDLPSGTSQLKSSTSIVDTINIEKLTFTNLVSLCLAKV